MATEAQKAMVSAINNRAGAGAGAETLESIPGTKPVPEDKYPEFLSTTTRPIVVALLSGHVCAISADPENPTKLHPRFHRRAVELGAMPATIAKQMQEDNSGLEQGSKLNRDEIILKVVGEMVSQADINPSIQNTLFTKDGRPDCEQLTNRCGFLVRAPERDRLWDVYQGEVA